MWRAYICGEHTCGENTPKYVPTYGSSSRSPISESTHVTFAGLMHMLLTMQQALQKKMTNNTNTTNYVETYIPGKEIFVCLHM